jgi:hypothetical protein
MKCIESPLNAFNQPNNLLITAVYCATKLNFLTQNQRHYKQIQIIDNNLLYLSHFTEVDDFGDSDEGAEKKSDTDKYQGSHECRDVNAARLVDVHSGVRITGSAFRLRHVPALTDVDEPTFFQFLSFRMNKEQNAKS